MMHLLVWFNTVTLMLLTVAVSATLLLQHRYRRPWLFAYFIYLVGYGVNLFMQTFAVSAHLYNSPWAGTWTAVSGWTRLGVSLVLAIAAPLIAIPLVHGSSSTKTARRIGVGFAVVVLAIVAPYTFYGNMVFGTIANIVFNGYLLGLFVYSLSQIGMVRAEPLVADIRPFLVISVVAYATLLALGLLTLLFDLQLTASVTMLVNGSVCFAWSVAGIVLFLPYLRGTTERVGTMPVNFPRRYNLTAREQEVLERILMGHSAKEIGAELFISVKTVEAHTYKIYRKCGVQNRVGIVNLVRSS